jgi:hypothetical protein
MKYQLLPILTLLAGSAMYGQTSWLPNGEYFCGRIDAKGHLVPDLRDCNVPTQAEIDAHKPKPAASKTGVPISEHTEPMVAGDFRVQPGYTVTSGPSDAVTVTTHETTVVKLSDEEYNHLIWLRAAVTAEETRLAAKYGADPGQGCSLSLTNATQGCLTIAYRAPEHYEFHGAFLLIDHAQVIGDIRPGIDMNSPRVKFMESLPSDGVSESGSHITPKGDK